MAKLVSKTYGEALFAAATEKEQLDLFYESVRMVVGLFREHEEFCKLMCHPKISGEEKVKVLEETFMEKIPTEMVGLFTLLVTKGHAEELIPVCDYFIGLVKKEKRIGAADVTSAVELSDAQKNRVEDRLLETTGYHSLEMQYHVDPDLIGGIVIRIGDRVVDSSIQTKLQNLSRTLRDVKC